MTSTPTTASTPGARQRVPGRYWRLAALAGMASYLDSGILISLGLSLAIWQKHFGLTTLELGALSSLVTICIAVGSLVGGRLADIFGRKRVYNVDILIYALGAVIIVCAVNPIMIFIGLIVAGLAAGADLPTSLAMVSSYSPRYARGRLIGFTQVMWTLGIAITTFIGLAVSGLSYGGTQILFGALAFIALAVCLLRGLLKVDAEPVDKSELAVSEKFDPKAIRQLWTPGIRLALLATLLFYLSWGLAANTFGQFGNYFLVTVSGATQTTATLINSILIIFGIASSLAFVRLVDTKWRNRLFIIGGSVQVIGFIIAAITGGGLITGMIAGLTLYNISNMFAGEQSYKVWSQELFPGTIRATAQGFTYAICRALYAVAALLTPAFLAWSAQTLLWSIVGVTIISGLVGVYISYRLKPQSDPVEQAKSPATATQL